MDYSLALIEATSFFVFKRDPSTALKVTKQKRYSGKQETAPKNYYMISESWEEFSGYLFSISDLTAAETNWNKFSSSVQHKDRM